MNAKCQILTSSKKHSYFKNLNLVFDRGLYTRCNVTRSLQRLTALSHQSLFSTYDYMYTASISIAMLVLLQLLIWKTEAVLM